MIGPTPATLEECLPIAQIHHAAFAAANLPLYNHIWGKCATTDLHAFRVELYSNAVRNRRGPTRIVVMRDEPTGEVLSFAMWRAPKSHGGDDGGMAVDHGLAEELVGDGKYVKRKGTPWVFPEGYNASVMARSGEQSAERERHLPEPLEKMWNLAFLATKPGHEGRGAARELVRWGFAQADIGSQMCAVSTDVDSPAFKFYEAMGFRTVGPMTLLDFVDFGGDGVLRYVTMVREPCSETASQDLP